MLFNKSTFSMRNEKINYSNFLFFIINLLLIFNSNTSISQAIVSTDPLPAFEIDARIRNGNSGFESSFSAPSTPAPGQPGILNLNPSGAPIWNSNGNVYGDIHTFLMTYDYLTGTTTWNIDFNRDSDYADNQESISYTEASLIGKGFKYINLFIQGSSTGLTANVNNLTINGRNMGGFSSNSDTPNSPLFTDSLGLFTTINITGQFSLSGNGGQERPRVWVRLGTPNAPPSCNVLSPTPDITITSPSEVLIDITALDADGNIAAVQFLRQNFLLISDLIAPYTYTVNVNELGTVNVQIIAIDNLGARCISDILLEIVACIPEDFNGDGFVNTSDFLSLVGLFGQNCDACKQDLDSNGVVNTADFLMLVAKFNFECL